VAIAFFVDGQVVVYSRGRFRKRFDVILGYETPERQLDLVQSQGLLENSWGRKGELNTQVDQQRRHKRLRVF